MTIQQHGLAALALVVEPHELQQQGLTYEQFDDVQARNWLDKALLQTGQPHARPTRIEIFAGNGGVLVLAQLELPRVAYVFDSLDTLLDAVTTLGATQRPACLYQYNNTFILVLTGQPWLALQEYSTLWPRVNLALLNEHGRLLLRHDALSRLSPAGVAL